MRRDSLLLPFVLATLYACDPSTTPSPSAASPDPALAPVSAFRLYTVSVWNDGPYTNETTMDSSGNVVRVAGHLDDIDTLRAVLPPADLARAKVLLEASSSRISIDIPPPSRSMTTVDPTTGAVVEHPIPWDGGSRTTRTIRYSDGSASTLSAHSAARSVPAAWTALAPVDSLLAALFPE